MDPKNVVLPAPLCPIMSTSAALPISLIAPPTASIPGRQVLSKATPRRYQPAM